MAIGVGVNPEQRPAAFGRFIRDLRKRTGLSQAQLGRKVGVSRPWISSVERGWLGSDELMLKILGVLDVPEPDQALRHLLGRGETGVRGDSPTEHFRYLARVLRTRLAELDEIRSTVTLSGATVSAIKATIFDLEELADSAESRSVAEDDPEAKAAKRAWRYFNNALMFVREAANASRLGLAVSQEPPNSGEPAPTGEELSNGDHQTG